MYTLCASGTANIHGFIWTFFMRHIYIFIHSFKAVLSAKSDGSAERESLHSKPKQSTMECGRQMEQRVLRATGLIYLRPPRAFSRVKFLCRFYKSPSDQTIIEVPRVYTPAKLKKNHTRTVNIVQSMPKSVGL